MLQPYYTEKHQSFGTKDYPGIHTTNSRELATLFANMKFRISDTQSQVPRVGYVHIYHSYPIILEIQVNGLSAQPDYDVLNHDGPFFEHMVEINTYPEFLQAMLLDYESEFQRSFNNINGVSSAIYAWTLLENYPSLNAYNFLQNTNGESIFNGLKKDPSSSLAYGYYILWADQYRYTDPIPWDRVKRIWYVKPFYPALLESKSDWESQELAEIEAYGFIPVFKDDIKNLSTSYALIYENVELEGGFQYHGMGYKNLLAAFEQAEVLEEPPIPYKTPIPGHILL